jgi:NADPH:quinone reductase-like Zn-dependent oxidoreductase
MKAAVIEEWGGPEVFRITELPVPAIQPDQIMIKVKRVGINPVDWKHRYGHHRLILGSSFPVVLGYDVCGEVVKTGNAVTRFHPGDIVFGDLDQKYGGGLAEYAVGSDQCFAIKPKNITETEAAGFPLVSLTVLRALRDKAALKLGQSVIINGAAGGVGHIALQMAGILGAKVTAVASSASKDFVMRFNPDQFLSYDTENLIESNLKCDLFFDVTGNYSFLKTKKLINRGGTYLTTLPRPKVIIHNILGQLFYNRSVKTVLRKHNARDMQLIADWIAEGKLTIAIDRVFSIDQISQAYQWAEQGKTKGKNIIIMA